MNAHEIVGHLNKVLDLCDTLDQNEQMGVRALTDGKHSSREALRYNLGYFLLYVGGSNGHLTDGEVALLNVVMNTEYTAQQFMYLYETTDDPTPTSCLILMGFLSGDIALNQQSGRKETQLTDVLIQLFESMANVMLAFDDDATGRARKTKFISGMQAYVWKRL